MKTDKQYYKYAYDIVENKIVSGTLIKLACKRFIKDLSDERFEFREDQVDKCISFMQIFKHYTGKHNGQEFELMPWQCWLVANIVGFYWKGTNIRRFTSSYISVSRKNGKSFLAGALCMYFLIADGEPSSEVLLLANSREQAKEVDYKICSALAEQLDPKQKYIKYFRDSITISQTKSKLKVLSCEAKSGDGYNCFFGLIDEYHESSDTKMKDLISSSMGMRESPHLCVITTSGFDKSKPCYELRTICVEILNNLKEDETQFAAIYELDESDNWQLEENWIKSNPCLDQTVTLRYIREQVNKAKNNPSEEVGVRTKTLNQWCDSATVWIPEDYIIKCTDTVDISNFKGQNCYVGVDLAATSDLTAVSYMFVNDENDKYYFKTHYYLPESALNEKKDKETYKLWKRLGLLTVTPGNVTDYDFITADIQKARQIVNIISIAYDSYNATQWAIKCTEEGLPLEPFSQSLGNFNKPTKELERLLLSGKAVIDNNEITRQCFRNVALKSDHNNNVKPVKKMDNNKIDGIISMLQALGVYLLTPRYSNQIFTI